MGILQANPVDSEGLRLVVSEGIRLIVPKGSSNITELVLV